MSVHLLAEGAGAIVKQSKVQVAHLESRNKNKEGGKKMVLACDCSDPAVVNVLLCVFYYYYYYYQCRRRWIYYSLLLLRDDYTSQKHTSLCRLKITCLPASQIEADVSATCP